MQESGIEVRPVVPITGDAEFNEVFFDEVFVPDDHLVGALHNGWAVANTTLAHERGTSFPFKEQVVHEVFLDDLYALASERSELRSEEHTSELQSRQYLVCRLLLEKKNYTRLFAHWSIRAELRLAQFDSA